MLTGSDQTFVIMGKWNVANTEPYYLLMSFLPSQPFMFTAVPDLKLYPLLGKNLLEYINRPPNEKLRMSSDSLENP